ncbi:SGNH/GDSL hydrolase family protein [Nocardia sp. SYP-A9097]|uniref:SGNH/GDSL hydrolase family protein n=1 Tax=Nocardia sp. SYP-A9097 TaxID=2663237 RepID=UPI002815751D|nr:SGNH/GDSL hydrolase family protein [Nocardia sp. SYP-A9097]
MRRRSISAHPMQCLRSTANTPKLVAASLGVRLDDRTCSSAKIPHLTTSQGAGIAPQLDGLGPNTKLVTVHIGANDADMTKYILTCHLAGAKPCADPAWGSAIDGIAAAYSTALHQISVLAPNAKVYVDGWPTYVSEGGCADLAGLRPADAIHIQIAFDRLSAVVAREAVAAGAVYIDTRPESIGHDMCAPVGTRWFEPLLATQTLLPYHPTLEGMRGVADIIVRSIRATQG